MDERPYYPRQMEEWWSMDEACYGWYVDDDDKFQTGNSLELDQVICYAISGVVLDWDHFVFASNFSQRTKETKETTWMLSNKFYDANTGAFV